MTTIPDDFKKAVNTALNILDYADNTEQKLREKLRRKGYTEAQTDFAAEYVKSIGVLDDARFIARESERLATAKLYGRRRIAQELYAKGFRRDDIVALDLSGIDFPALCARRITKTRSRYPDDRKMYVSLLRYGFTPDDISSAFALLRE